MLLKKYCGEKEINRTLLCSCRVFSVLTLIYSYFALLNLYVLHSFRSLSGRVPTINFYRRKFYNYIRPSCANAVAIMVRNLG